MATITDFPPIAEHPTYDGNSVGIINVPSGSFLVAEIDRTGHISPISGHPTEYEAKKAANAAFKELMNSRPAGATVTALPKKGGSDGPVRFGTYEEYEAGFAEWSKTRDDNSPLMGAIVEFENRAEADLAEADREHSDTIR